MNSSEPKALILFAKDPVEGKVKTRLQTLLDAKTACQLYLRILDDTIDRIGSVSDADLFVGIHPSNASGYFDRVALSNKMKIFDQEGADLGQRMRHAFQQRFKEGYKKVVIVGGRQPNVAAGLSGAGLAHRSRCGDRTVQGRIRANNGLMR